MKHLWAGLLVVAGLLPSQAAPVVFWASSPVRPGEVAMLIGEGFGAAPKVTVAVAADDGGAVGRPQPAEVMQGDDQAVKFVVPAGLAAGVHQYRVQGADGAVTGWLNRPALWWAQGDQGPAATPGGWLRLFGVGLGQEAAKAAISLTGPVTRRLVAVGGSYALRAELPADLPPGDYRVTCHRGQGGQAGWSEAVTVSVTATRPWPTAVINVKDCGASGDGRRDDLVPVREALAKAAAAGGGVVYFPRGRYWLTDALVIPRFTVLRGERTDLVNLAFADLAKAPEALLRGSNSFAIEHLTVYASRHQHVISSDIGAKPENGDVHLRGVRVRANTYRGHQETKEIDERFRAAQRLSTGGGDTVRLSGRNLSITGCDLYGSGRSLFLHRARGALVSGNKLYNGRWGWYCFEGSQGLIFEQNSLIGADLQSTGGGLANYSTPASEHIYYAENGLDLMHGWDREAMTTDAGGGAYLGGVAAVAGTETTLAADPTPAGRDWAGAGIFILDGKGRGQHRRIAKLDGRRVTCDRPWDLAPDATSTVTITMFHGRYLFVGNSFTDSGVALQLYGMVCEVVADGNRSCRTGGFHNFGMQYHGIQPSWYVQWLNNEITEGNVYRSGHDNYLQSGEAHLGIFALPPGPAFKNVLTLGCVARGNRLRNNAHLAVGGTDPYNPAFTLPTTQEVVVEGNEITDTEFGIFVRRAARGVVLRNNRCERVTEPVRDEVAMLKAAEERRRAILSRPGPLLSYPFDQPAGNTVRDASGNRFDAGAYGTVTFEPGRQGTAARFRGQSYLRLDEPQVFNLSNLTVALWIKPDQVAGRQGLIGKRFDGTAAPFVISLWDGGIEFEATDTEGKWSFNFRSPAVVKAGEWSHVAVVVAAGRGVTIYVNGQPVAEKQNKLQRVSNEQPLIIGREAWGGVNMVHEPCFYQGLMDELTVWGRAMSPEDVAKLAISSAGGG